MDGNQDYDPNGGEDDMETDTGTGTDSTTCQPGSDLYYPPVEYPELEHNPGFPDWQYNARRCTQEIFPGLYLGPYSSAIKSARDNLVNMGITHIVCVRSEIESRVIRTNHMDIANYLVIEINDSLFQGIIPEIKRVITFLDDCFKNGGRALVHGNAGMTRSATMVMGYVMWRYGVTAKMAKNYVQSKRMCVCLNDNFMKQLEDFEACVRAMHDVPASCSGAENPLKRQNEDDDDDGDDNSGNGTKRIASEDAPSVTNEGY